MVVAGGGPSLTAADLERCRGRARVIVVNDAYRLAPWADLLYAGDRQWWWAHWDSAGAFAGPKVGLLTAGREPPDFRRPVLLLRSTGPEGLELDPSRGIRTGGNSGHQAVNLAVHLGAKRLVLLGFDMQAVNGRAHWHGDHGNGLGNPRQLHFDRWRSSAAGLAKALKAAGIEAVNCSRATALTSFTRAALEEVLP